jgi:glycosyltransferase involved in cell wall biosynthesis
MQALYRKLDRWCCYYSDAVWNVSASMEEARREHGLDLSRSAPQIEVPLGNRFEEIPKPPPERRVDGLITFLGSLTKEQGLNLMLEALPKIKHRIPHVKLRIIGDGPEMHSLKQLAQELEIRDSVQFLGFVEDDARAAELAAEGTIAIAPYTRTKGTYKRFADPGKVTIYLAAGLPVVISRVPPVADLIEDAGAGVAVDPSADGLADAVADLLSSPEKIRAMRAKALELGKKFDWTGIFDRAFKNTFAQWEKRN